jgi:hypothetical protein
LSLQPPLPYNEYTLIKFIIKNRDFHITNYINAKTGYIFKLLEIRRAIINRKCFVRYFTVRDIDVSKDWGSNIKFPFKIGSSKNSTSWHFISSH